MVYDCNIREFQVHLELMERMEMMEYRQVIFVNKSILYNNIAIPERSLREPLDLDREILCISS